MNETEHIVSIIPAPAGLIAIYGPTKDETKGFKDPVVALALIQTDRFTHTERELVAMVIDPDVGTLTPAHDASNFEGIKWQQQPPACQCSTTSSKP